MAARIRSAENVVYKRCTVPVAATTPSGDGALLTEDGDTLTTEDGDVITEEG